MTDSIEKARIYHEKYYDNPNQWTKDLLGVFLWSKQQEILDSVFRYPRTAVAAAHGVGKTFVAACAILSFMYIRHPCKIITSAPTFKQVADLLWSEINALWKAKLKPMGFPGECLNTKIKRRDDWFALGISPRDSVNFQGYHSPHILVVLDETPGIRQDIIEGAETLLSSQDAHLLCIGNPTTTSGFFYNAFRDKSFNTIHISAFDSPNFTGEKMPAQARASLVSKAWVEDKEKRWGKKSPVYQSRVLGEFPTESVNTIISLKVCEDAMAREIEQSDKLEKEMAIDVARYGDDETTIAIRQGLKIEEILVLSKRDNVYIANKAERIVRNDKLITSVKVDVIGVGAGVFDILNNSLTKSGIEVIPIDVSERAYDADLYYNKRAEMWFEMAKWLETGSIPNDLDLVSDLTVPQYKFNSRGKYQVQSKEEIKEVLGRSTDRGDAATMVCYDRLGLTMSNLSTSARSLETKDLLRSVGIGAYM
jgi:hypothetical protein